MAAGMSLGSGGAGEGLTAGFRHGQGIHIRTEKQGFPALTQLGGNAVTACFRLQSGFFQLSHDIAYRLGHVQPNFRILVQIPTMGDGFRL